MKKLKIEKIRLQNLSDEDSSKVIGGQESTWTIVTATLTIVIVVTGASNTACNGDTCATKADGCVPYTKGCDNSCTLCN